MNPTQLYGVAPHPMYACCLPRAWVGPDPYVKKKMSLILLILLTELTNQKRGIFRHCILYHL